MTQDSGEMRILKTRRSDILNTLSRQDSAAAIGIGADLTPEHRTHLAAELLSVNHSIYDEGQKNIVAGPSAESVINQSEGAALQSAIKQESPQAMRQALSARFNRLHGGKPIDEQPNFDTWATEQTAGLIEAAQGQGVVFGDHALVASHDESTHQANRDELANRGRVMPVVAESGGGDE